MYDFVNWLCGTPERVSAAALPAVRDVRTVESSTVTISFANGSTATVVYSAEGAPEMPKERIEVFAGGRSWVLDDFASLTSYTRGNTKTVTAQKQDKGHAALMRSVLAASRGERPFEPGLTAAYVAQSVALATLEAIATGQTVAVELPPP